MKILVTGGAGYIGTHTCLELIAAGHDVVIFDNFCNSKPEAIRRVEAIAGVGIPVVQGDIRDRAAVEKALRDHAVEAVIHFAGLKAVGESVEKPLLYFDNNVNGSLSLLQAMEAANVRQLVFSSSATVYGDPQFLPLTESHPLSATNPYGRTKIMIEDMLRDAHRADPRWRFAILRYFNPVGAHESGLIGESPNGIPNNLMPYINDVAAGKRSHLNVFGSDYDTRDGTGIRDYIHVTDLAKGHTAALEKLVKDGGLITVNLGTGNGISVLEMVSAYKKASGRDIPYALAPRRAGDVASCYADASLAKNLLGWQAEKTLDDMCASSWNWCRANPAGYEAKSPLPPLKKTL